MIPQSSPLAGYHGAKDAIDTAIARVLESGWYILGEEVRRFERDFAIAMQARWSVGVGSGTDAIELALRALGVRQGDAVITVSHTAIATAFAIHRIGAVPLFVDIEPGRYTMSPTSLAAALATPEGQRAKALVVVHLYGQMADMPALLELAGWHGLKVVEDCAQAHGASLKGRLAGSWGDLAAYSFYPTKNLGALGDGGAIAGSDPALEQELKLLREYGWKQRYVSEVVGYNSRLDELQAAILNARLPLLSAANARRREIANRYDQKLAGSTVITPLRIANSIPVFHQYVIECEQRDALRKALTNAGINTLIHYPAAAHQQPVFSDRQHQPVTLTTTEAAVTRILSLPMFPELTNCQVDAVAVSVLQHAP